MGTISNGKINMIKHLKVLITPMRSGTEKEKKKKKKRYSIKVHFVL